MKVKLKFTVDQIISISAILNKICKINFNSLSHQEKINISICLVLSDTFEMKKRDIQKKNDLFNSRKKISIALKYHQVWALNQVLIDKFSLVENEYQKFNIQNSIHLLDSKK
ncbi:hypothetical protein V2595_06940 [Tenacibaculum maritimum]|uniref:hypothetical protein n=2 Tax=Tenacibaculum maritimum TaxID=107401 RepID=UPI003876AEC2